MTPGDRTAIVVPCRDVDALTRRCVQECLATCPAAEILIVPDAHPADGKDSAHTRVLPSGPINPAAKRNLAARESSREFLALIDSDAYPRQGWIDRAVGLLDADPTLGAVGGPQLSPPDQPLSRRAVGNASRSVLVSGPYSYRKRLARARDCSHLSSCNLVMRRSVYLDAGGMDEAFFTGDDTSLTARIRATGLRLRFSPDVVVYHSDRTLTGFLAQRIGRGLDVFREWVATGQPENVFYFLPALFLVFLLIGWLLLFWTPGRWLYLIVAGVYAAVCLFEGIRLSRSPAEFPGTLLALVYGNLGQGLGVLLRAVGVRLDVGKMYRKAR